MADDVTLPGTGVVVASDDVGGVQYQKMKLFDATNGSSAETGVNANPLKVAGPDSQQLLSTSLSTVTSSSVVDSSGYPSISIQIGGTWFGNLVVETNNDNGAIWNPTLVQHGSDLMLLDTISVSGMYVLKPTGRYFRFRTTSITGTVTILALGRSTVSLNASDMLSFAMDESSEITLNTKIWGSNLQPVAQDPFGSGALLTKSADRIYNGVSIASGTIMFTAPCSDMSYISATMVASASSSCQIEVLLPNGSWQSIFTYSIAATVGPMYTNSVSNSGTSGVYAVGNLSGASFVRVRSTSGNTIYVTAKLTNTAPLNGFFTSANPQSVQGAITASGAVAEDAAAGTSPVLVGGVVRTGAAPSTLVAGDVARNTLDTDARLIVGMNGPPLQWWSYVPPTSGLSNTTTAVTINAAAAGRRANITALQFSSTLLGSATEFVIRDGAAGTVMWRQILNAQAYPVTSVRFDPPLRQSATNVLLEMATLTAATGNLYVGVQGYYGN